MCTYFQKYQLLFSNHLYMLHIFHFSHLYQLKFLHLDCCYLHLCAINCAIFVFYCAIIAQILCWPTVVRIIIVLWFLNIPKAPTKTPRRLSKPFSNLHLFVQQKPPWTRPGPLCVKWTREKCERIICTPFLRVHFAHNRLRMCAFWRPNSRRKIAWSA